MNENCDLVLKIERKEKERKLVVLRKERKGMRCGVILVEWYSNDGSADENGGV